MISKRPLWILFDESDRRVPAPDFSLPGTNDRYVSKQDYCEDKNLVVYFPPSIDCAGLQAGLNQFAGSQEQYRQEDAQVLALLPGPVEAIGKADCLVNLPFPVLADDGQGVRRRYMALMVEGLTAPDDHLVFVLDVYGAPYAALIDKTMSDPALQSEIAQWLAYVAMQCPE